jgi:hypothetical protein
MFKRLGRTIQSARLFLASTVHDWLEAQIPTGYVQRSAEAWRIADGVNYNLFPVIPAGIRNLARTAATQEQGNKIIESFLAEAYPQYKSQWSDPYYVAEPFQMLSIGSPLAEMDFSTRVGLLEQSHLAWERNPLANTAVTLTRQFAVQNGMRRKYHNTDIEQIIEDFCTDPENNIKALEKELFDTLFVDGELFIRFHEGDGANGAKGEMVITSVPAWGIRAIEHELGFIKRVTEYLPSYSETTGVGTGGSLSITEPIPAKEILHVAINKLAYEQRGRPELLRLLPYLGGYKEWLENRGRQNAFRGTVVYDVTLNNATGSQVAAKRTQYGQPPQGVVLAVHNQNETWQVLESKIGAADAAEDGRAMKLMIAAGARLPEYMLSDGSNANLASATAQQLPALRTFADWQDIMVEQLWTPVFERLLLAAEYELDDEIDVHDEEGKPTGKKIAVREAFEVKYAEMEATDPKALAEALTLAVNAGWMSNETAANLLPFDIDYNAEQRKIEEELQTERDQIAQGLKPDPMRMFNQQPPQNGDNGNGANDNGSLQQQPEKQVQTT